VAPDSHEQDELAQKVIDFYLERWQEIVRNFKLQKYKDMREMLHFSLEMFINLNPHAYSSKHKVFLKRVHAEVKEHYQSLWAHFEEDEEYKKELLNSYAWLTQLKRECPLPPLTYLDLKVCFGACEAYMLVANAE
jgi:hypothetical protein